MYLIPETDVSRKPQTHTNSVLLVRNLLLIVLDSRLNIQIITYLI